jgi:anti-anti-sigma factor
VATLALGLQESHDNGVVRLAPVGELDLASAEQLVTRVCQLLAGGARVRLDLSRLEFIDSRGIYALIRAVALGREAGGERVEVDRGLSKNVRELLELTGMARMLWPQTRAKT